MRPLLPGAGLVAGGAYGIREGLKNSQGDRQRIRINAVLNSTGKHGPNLGNSIGCLGMMFSLFETIAYNIRGEDDLLNVIGAGALAGGVFKSQSVSLPTILRACTLSDCFTSDCLRLCRGFAQLALLLWA